MMPFLKMAQEALELLRTIAKRLESIEKELAESRK